MSRLIIGHTTESSTVIWVRGDARFPFAFVTITGQGVDRTQAVELEERHFFTGIAEFRQLTPSSAYSVRVGFGEQKNTREEDRVCFGSCDGTLKTFPPDDSAKPFKFIFGSCNLHSLGIISNPDKAFQRISEVARQKQALMMIHCGDQIYYDVPNFWKQPDLGEYRDKYLDAWGDSRQTRKFLTTLPQYMILDDHEIIDNFANDLEFSGFSATPQQYKDVAIKVYREFQHIRHPKQFGNQALYYQFNVGQVQFFVLDTRTERYRGTGNHSAQIIGSEQMKAFLSWLRKHKTAVKFVVTSVPFVFEVKNTEDKWNSAAFREQREKVLEHIVDNQIEGTTFLTGDMHCSGHAELVVTKATETATIHELMSSPINQLGKRSFSDFDSKVTRKSETQEFEYTSTIAKSEFYDEHSNATTVTVDRRKISYEIFRTKKKKSTGKNGTFTV